MTDFANLLDGEAYDPAAPSPDPVPDLTASLPDDPQEMADVGIYLRNQGSYERAEAIFQAVIDRFPQFIFGWQEMAILRQMTGRQEEAVALQRRAVEIDPGDLLVRKNLAFQLLKHGDAAQATAVLDAHPRGGAAETDAAVRALVQFIDFITGMPCDATLAMIDRFEKSGRFLIGDELGNRIVAAAEAGEPFSLVRLGDGEGAWLHTAQDDEARFADLYEANRRAILRVWFGSDRLYGSRSFTALRDRMTTLIQRADVIGLPSGLRLVNEYRNQSIRSIPPCINILRGLAVRLESADPGIYCGQDAHLDLHLNGFWHRLLAMPFTFGVITCHPALGYRLASRFGTRVVRALIVPEEKGFSQIAGISGMAEPHYPVAFIRNLERLEREARDATIWLVAAGYLGKIYCDEIRQAGGIALDVGSIVDGWSGKVTRPTMSNVAQFAL